MKNLSEATARNILDPIFHRVTQGHPLSPAEGQSVIDAMDHPEDSVVNYALFTLGHVNDKTPFESVLIKHAMDHSKPGRAEMAYFAMHAAQNPVPFYTALQAGCRATEAFIARAALGAIETYTEATRTLPSCLHQPVIDAMGHLDVYVMERAFTVIAKVDDKAPFVSALQNISNTRFAFKPWAEKLLKDILPPSPTAPPIKGVRLDFNIGANGVGEHLHKREVVETLTELFSRSNTVAAAVFYDPGKALSEGDVVAVSLSEDQHEAILTEVLRGIAPAFDLVPQDHAGTYKAALSGGPT